MSREIDRREFLKSVGTAAAAASLGGAGLILQGCAAGKDYDLVIKGGLVYDGLGGDPFEADIGVSGERIKTVGPIPGRSGRIVVEAAALTEDGVRYLAHLRA